MDSKLKVVNIYKIKTDKGVVLFPRTEVHRGGDIYDPEKHDDLVKFWCEENTSAYNILMTGIVFYNKENDTFVEDPDEIYFYVGHVTLDEWTILENRDYFEDGRPNVEAALDIIKERTGIDHREEFQK